MKAGQFNTAMQKRWFKLNGSTLTYSVKPDSKEPKGVIDVTGARVHNMSRQEGRARLWEWEKGCRRRAWPCPIRPADRRGICASQEGTNMI